MSENLNSVKMTDDRIVDFVGKRKMLKSSWANADGSVEVRFDFVNGETRTYKLNPALLLDYAAHGAEQKFGDETAGLQDIDDMVLAIEELAERHASGQWNVKREGSGVAGTSTLVRALVEFTGKTVDEVKTFLSTKTQTEKLALRANDKIRPIVERIEAEKTKKASNVNTDALLGELGG